MKRFLLLNLMCGALIGVSALCQTASAAPTPVTIILGGCGFVVASDCVSPDTLSKVTSDKISLSSAGVWTASCTGTTTTAPTKATKCDGETLNASGTEGTPVDPCEMQLEQFSSTTGPIFTDDWTETITPTGKIHLICKFSATETGK